MLTEDHDIALTHFASLYSSYYSAPLFFACIILFLLTSCFYTPVYSSVYSASYSASPLHLLTPIIPLTNPLQIADQFLTKHLLNFVYKATGPPIYKPAAKGCKRVSTWPSIYILIISITAYPPLLFLDLQVTSAGLKSSSSKLSRLSSI